MEELNHGVTKIIAWILWWNFCTANMKQKMFAVTVCDHKIRKEIYDSRILTVCNSRRLEVRQSLYKSIFYYIKGNKN